MIQLRPSLSRPLIVAATALFATSTFAHSELELLALAAPGDELAASLKAENAWVREVLTSSSLVKS
jgi:putative tricarboxylic transport membrane protein